MNRLDVIERVLTCTRCELSANCTAPVAFSSPEHPTIAVLGEAPGAQEDELGVPFIGPAGQHLRESLAAVGINPDQVAYLNTVSCFPHDTPSPEHVDACAGNKATQLDYLDPTYVLVVGKVALRGTLRVLQIRHGRGRPFKIGDFIYFATYHPSAALRKGTYDIAMQADLERFATLVSFGPDHWLKMIPDSCSACNVDAQWWDVYGLGWCPLHVPDAERQEYEARQALIAADLDALRRRHGEHHGHDRVPL